MLRTLGGLPSFGARPTEPLAGVGGGAIVADPGCRRAAVQGVAAPRPQPGWLGDPDGGGGPWADVGGFVGCRPPPRQGSNRCPRGGSYSIYKHPSSRSVGDLCTCGRGPPSSALLSPSLAMGRSCWPRRPTRRRRRPRVGIPAPARATTTAWPSPALRALRRRSSRPSRPETSPAIGATPSP
jgi:hypothetical protein